jgi:D-lactate dehydrogenase (cytochrome)
MATKTLWTPTSKSTLPLSEAPSLSYNHSQENIDGLLPNIESTSLPEVCASKSSTPLSFAPPEHVPLLVLYPKSTQDVSSILKACHERNIAVTSFGGGTSLGGALAATRGGICIDFRDMGAVLEVNEEDQDVRVQPNIGWVELSEYLEPRGFWLYVCASSAAIRDTLMKMQSR